MGKTKRATGQGRKKYTDAKQYVVPIQFYRKAEDIEILGGKDAVKQFSEENFDRELIKKLKTNSI